MPVLPPVSVMSSPLLKEGLHSARTACTKNKQTGSCLVNKTTAEARVKQQSYHPARNHASKKTPVQAILLLVFFFSFTT